MSTGTDPRHPIRVAAARTGLTPAVIRAWERRYDVVRPERTESGRRLYSDAQVHRLSLIRRASRGGRTIVDLARLDTETIASLVVEDERSHEVRRGWGTDGVEGWLDRLEHGGPRVFARALYATTLNDGLGEEWRSVIGGLLPLLMDASEGGGGALDRSDSRLALLGMQEYLEWLRRAFRGGPSTHKALVVSKGGWLDQVAADFVSIVALSRGWFVPRVGAGVSPDAVEELAKRTGSSLVVVLAERSPFNADEVAGLINARKRLPEWVGVVAAGTAAGQLMKAWQVSGVDCYADLVDLEEAFEGRGGRAGRWDEGALT